MSEFLDVEIAEILVSLDDEPAPTVIEVAAETTTVVELTVEPDVLLPDVVEINTGLVGPTGPQGPPGPAGPGSPFLVLTQAQYNALPVKDPNTVYVVT